VGKPKGCFPTFMDGIPSKTIGVDKCYIYCISEYIAEGLVYNLLTTLRKISENIGKLKKLQK
jgi:hypothetical protein